MYWDRDMFPRGAVVTDFHHGTQKGNSHYFAIPYPFLPEKDIQLVHPSKDVNYSRTVFEMSQ